MINLNTEAFQFPADEVRGIHGPLLLIPGEWTLQGWSVAFSGREPAGGRFAQRDIYFGLAGRPVHPGGGGIAGEEAFLKRHNAFLEQHPGAEGVLRQAAGKSKASVIDELEQVTGLRAYECRDGQWTRCRPPAAPLERASVDF
jgi:hypothetical protein